MALTDLVERIEVLVLFMAAHGSKKVSAVFEPVDFHCGQSSRPVNFVQAEQELLSGGKAEMPQNRTCLEHQSQEIDIIRGLQSKVICPLVVLLHCQLRDLQPNSCHLMLFQQLFVHKAHLLLSLLRQFPKMPQNRVLLLYPISNYLHKRHLLGLWYLGQLRLIRL